MKKAEFEKKLEGHCTVHTFANEHGEKFNIYKPDGIFSTIFFASDETDWEVVPLFHPSFNIWSDEELVKLGLALQKLNES